MPTRCAARGHGGGAAQQRDHSAPARVLSNEFGLLTFFSDAVAAPTATRRAFLAKIERILTTEREKRGEETIVLLTTFSAVVPSVLSLAEAKKRRKDYQWDKESISLWHPTRLLSRRGTCRGRYDLFAHTMPNAHLSEV